MKTSLVTAAGAERQLGYVVSVDLTPGVVGGVGEGAVSPQPVSHRGGRRGKAVGTMGVFWKRFADGFIALRAGGRKGEVRYAPPFSILKG